MSRFAVVTIADSNYIKKSLAMLNSVKNFNGDVDTFFLITDGKIESVPNEEIEFISIEDLLVNPQILDSMYLQRNPVEFATAIKPFCLSYLLELGYESVVYLDPDILVVNSLDNIFETSKVLGTLITPHRLTTSNAEHLVCEDVKFLEFGAFNLGFIAVNQGSKPFLEWWGTRTRFSSTESRFESVFTDQKWIDLSPAYFDVHIFRDFGANVAYWNIDERLLEYSLAEGFKCNTEKLLFIHFSQSSDQEISTGALGPKWYLLRHNSQVEKTFGALVELKNRWENLQSMSFDLEFQQRAKREHRRKKRVIFTFSAVKRGIKLDLARLNSFFKDRQ